nr:immunoglobulin heavy chain junction region [Macaca mulatta]MOW22725.1 immunoglobulin heavy chain junction region [Macaca mulatta]MOW22755.1 immunoglobulin heavy chain junction region [Macaca mulatta]MOW22895.1 immunoglobulin heavy chain junction region [Macaca mulatta]MOW22924.1 immunoglobulin heavy chain junction region [Macaca mulatta]
CVRRYYSGYYYLDYW